MESTVHDALPAVLSVTGIGKIYAEPVLADVALTLHAGAPYAPADRTAAEALGVRRIGVPLLKADGLTRGKVAGNLS